jgi:hypothetical protein
MGAFCFESESDPDFHIKYLMKALTPEEFLRVIIRLRPEEALYKVLVEHWQENLKVINGIKK